MDRLINEIARKLIALWDSLTTPVLWAIERAAGSGIVNAVNNGYSSLVNYLSGLSSSVLNSVAKLIGL